MPNPNHTQAEAEIAEQLKRSPLPAAQVITGAMALIFLAHLQMDEGETWGYLQVFSNWALVTLVTLTIKQGVLGLLKNFPKS